MILSFDVGIKNLAYCLIDNERNILDWHIIDCTSSNPILTLIKQLDTLPHLLESTTVLIEKQPSFNPKMRIIGGCLYTYFTLRIQHELNKKVNILFYSAKNKLKNTNITNIIAKNKYQRNKKLAIEETKYLLNDTEWISFFLSHKKKDDLADSFLQGLSYIVSK
jgi:hypothetical protein